MIAQQMLNAFSIVQKIMTLKLPVKKAYKVYSLAKQINDKRDFFINEEKKLVNNFQAEIGENGRIMFKSEEDRVSFMKEHAELLSCEIEDIIAVELSFDDLGDTELSPVDFVALEGVINFID